MYFNERLLNYKKSDTFKKRIDRKVDNLAKKILEYPGHIVTLTPYFSKGHHASLDTFLKACKDLELVNLGKLSKGRGINI
jgi:hypothetical protein